MLTIIFGMIWFAVVTQIVFPPAPSPRPLVGLTPDIEAIFAAVSEMSEAEKADYSQELARTRVRNWRGRITTISPQPALDRYTITVEMLNYKPGPELYFSVTDETAAALREGQRITFSGQVVSLSHNYQTALLLENVTIK